MAKLVTAVDGVVDSILSSSEFEDVYAVKAFRQNAGQEVYITNDLVQIGDPVVNGVVQTKKQYKTKYTYEEFTELFTDAELENILTAAKTDVKVEVFLTRIKAKAFINVKNNKIENKINYLETKGYIATGRAAELILGTEVVV